LRNKKSQHALARNSKNGWLSTLLFIFPPEGFTSLSSGPKNEKPYQSWGNILVVGLLRITQSHQENAVKRAKIRQYDALKSSRRGL
jgi:hypothetical protein